VHGTDGSIWSGVRLRRGQHSTLWCVVGPCLFLSIPVVVCACALSLGVVREAVGARIGVTDELRERRTRGDCGAD
jgi:hypothetical protein